MREVRAMNSLFMRIYWGLLISLLVVSLFSYLTLQTINHYRHEQYRINVAKGVMHLMVENLKEHESDARYVWLSRVKQILGAEVELVKKDDFSLVTVDLKALDSNEVVYRVVNPDRRLEAYLPVDEEDFYLRMVLGDFSEQQARGQAKLIIDELTPIPPEQWPEKIAALSPLFGFPLALVTLDLASQDESHQRRLRQGETLVSWTDELHQYVSLNVTAPIKLAGQATPQFALLMGPVPMFDWFPLHFTLIIGVFALVLLGLAGYLLVRPLESGMKRMEKAIGRISAGDLGARAYVDSNDALGHLAMTINDMAEHLQRLIKSQREMTNAVSHELRTPVARIRFGLESIDDYADDASVSKQIALIDEDIEELNNLIDEILTYATLEEGRPALQLEEIEVASVLSRVRDESLASGHDKLIELVHHDYPEDDPRRYAECEARYIHRVVQNLVNNAVRYAESKVRVHCFCEGNMYRIDVEDDGVGIEPENWESVFTPFARLDTSRNRKSGGYGLGLSIVKSIAYWHGGVASVYHSELGGAKFTVIWPKKQSYRINFDKNEE